MAIQEVGAPSLRQKACAVWTGREVFVWGGMAQTGELLNTGAAYNPITNQWRDIAANTLSEREEPICVAMGNDRVLVWGGRDSSDVLQDGAVWTTDGSSNEWEPVTTDGRPEKRSRAISVWTGSEVVIWGGEKFDTSQESSGAKFHPLAGWTTISEDKMPSYNKGQAWAWSGQHLYTFGGRSGAGVTDSFHLYNPTKNQWIPTTGTGMAPERRSDAFAAWTGQHFVVWGGVDAMGNYLNTGGVFDQNGNWRPMDYTDGVPTPRARIQFQSGWNALVGTKVLIAGGTDDAQKGLSNMSLFDPAPLSVWEPSITWPPPHPHVGAVAVWTGDEFILWSGTDGLGPTGSGTRWGP